MTTATTARRPSRASRAAAATQPKLRGVPAQTADAETNASLLAGVTTTKRTAPKPAPKRTAPKPAPKPTPRSAPAKSAAPKSPPAPSRQLAAAELATQLIKAGADFADKCELPVGMTREEAVAQVGKWLAYLPARAEWDTRLGPRSDAGKRPKAS